MNRSENRHSATKAPAWTTRSRAELMPFKNCVDRRPAVSGNRHSHGATDVRSRRDKPQADQHQYAG
jgi:hypothetical protein